MSIRNKIEAELNSARELVATETSKARKAPKVKPVKIINPVLTMGDAMSFKFRVMGNFANRSDFEDDIYTKVAGQHKFLDTTFTMLRSRKESDVWQILSANSTAMIDLRERLPKLAAKNGLTIRNIK